MAKWGSGRQSVLLYKEQIENQLMRGVPLKQIYRQLDQQGRIDVTYNSFRRQVISLIKPHQNFRTKSKEASSTFDARNSNDDTPSRVETIQTKQKEQNELILVASTKRY